MTTDEIDRVVHEFLVRPRRLPVDAGLQGFPKSCCTSLNEVICHGIPDSTVIEDGDIVNVDVTAYIDGVHGDTNATFCAGDVDEEARLLVERTHEATMRGDQGGRARAGRSTSSAGSSSRYAKRFGYGVVRDFTGHGIGETFHSGLVVPHYDEPARRPTCMEPGMTFTIEPMITLGTYRLRHVGRRLDGGHQGPQADGAVRAHHRGHRAAAPRSSPCPEIPGRRFVPTLDTARSLRGALMAKVYDGIDADMAAWIERQPMFFVATAPLAADGLVNLSPKGTGGTFRVVDAHTFAYLDITGSGVETVAHLRENGRICVMFCSFDRRPTIVRLHGTGRAVLADDPGFDAELAGFGEAGASRRPYLRGVIVVDVARVADSCGYAVPRMELVEERETLDRVWRTRDDERIATYHAERNATSLDGLPGLDGSAETPPPIPLRPTRLVHVIIGREGEERA